MFVYPNYKKACLFTLIIKRDNRKPQSEFSRRGKIWPGNLRLVMIQVRTPSTSDAFGKICSVSSDLHLLTYGWMKDASCGRSNAHFSTARFGGWEAFPRFAGNGLPGPHAPPLVSSLGRVVRIRNGHPGKYFGAPVLKLLVKVRRTARFVVAQVVLLSNVVGQDCTIQNRHCHQGTLSVSSLFLDATRGSVRGGNGDSASAKHHDPVRWLDFSAAEVSCAHQ